MLTFFFFLSAKLAGGPGRCWLHGTSDQHMSICARKTYSPPLCIINGNLHFPVSCPAAEHDACYWNRLHGEFGDPAEALRYLEPPHVPFPRQHEGKRTENLRRGEQCAPRRSQWAAGACFSLPSAAFPLVFVHSSREKTAPLS